MDRWTEVAPDYLCPLCQGHEDEYFIWSGILHKPICKGCSDGLWDDIFWQESRPDSELLDRLEQLTNLTYEEYSLIEIESVIDDRTFYVTVGREHVNDLTAQAARLKAIIKAG